MSSSASIRAVLGVDIGTGSSKGVLADLDGNVLASETREHRIDRPNPGWVEMDAAVWWGEFCSIAAALITDAVTIVGVGVSGMDPCVLIADETSTPLRPAILYGVDTRATAEIEALTAELGGDAVILGRCGSTLSTQAVGPKLEWLNRHEPERFARARRLFMPASWLAYNLTGEYGLDHHSASQCTPLYDTQALNWYEPWTQRIAPDLEFPPLLWPGDVVGQVSPEAAGLTGIPAGVPVCMGTIDAWTEAVSVGATEPGDLMLMYGTTMFLVHTVAERIDVPELWGTVGAYEGTRCLAGGMATSGAITSWLRELFGSPAYPQLLAEAHASGPGSRGVIMLPYFAGERTPIADPDARGIIAGLTISTNRGDLYRGALEATAMGVRHNIEAMENAGGKITRIVAVGGGTKGGLWTQIVSDVTGRDQIIPAKTIGASYGAAFLIAHSTAERPLHITDWNPGVEVVTPSAGVGKCYEDLYRLYRELYSATRDIQHRLAESQRSAPT